MEKTTLIGAPEVAQKRTLVTSGLPEVVVAFFVPDDQQWLLPRRRRSPSVLPANVPIPRRGEVVYLSSTSAWFVELVIHEWRSPVDLMVQVWLTYMGGARAVRSDGFQVTQ